MIDIGQNSCVTTDLSAEGGGLLLEVRAKMPDPLQTPDNLEKGQAVTGPSVDAVDEAQEHESIARTEPTTLAGKVGRQVKRVEQLLVAYNLEARGIQRVEAHERHAVGWKDYLQVFLLWLSVNLAAINITLGMLAPTLYGLSFLDASLCAVFGSIVGSIPVAWIATWGPISGNRTLVRKLTRTVLPKTVVLSPDRQIFARYTMGWWPSKLVVLLNIILLLGYALIDCVVAGQILSAVSPDGSMSVVVGNVQRYTYDYTIKF